MQNKTALVVDDSRVARMTLTKLLVANGFDIEETGSGEEALAYLKTSHKKPDIIFMDVMMEGMDGLTATRQIKASPDLQSIPVVICTGNDTEADIDQAKSTGAVAVLSKPPAADALTAILQRLPVAAPESVVQPSVEPAPAEPAEAIDEQAIIAKVLQAVEQQWVPKLEQKMRESAEDISGQIAQDVAEEASKAHLQTLSEPLQNQLTQRVTESAQQAVHNEVESASKKLIDNVNRTAADAIQRAMAEYGLQEKVMVMMRSEGTNWLKQQEQTLAQQLTEQVRQQLELMSNRYLDENLTQKVTPIVNSNVTAMMNEHNAKDQQLAGLSKRVNLLTAACGALAVLAIVSLAASFLA